MSKTRACMGLAGLCAAAMIGSLALLGCSKPKPTDEMATPEKVCAHAAETSLSVVQPSCIEMLSEIEKETPDAYASGSRCIQQSRNQATTTACLSTMKRGYDSILVKRERNEMVKRILKDVQL